MRFPAIAIGPIGGNRTPLDEKALQLRLFTLPAGREEVKAKLAPGIGVFRSNELLTPSVIRRVLPKASPNTQQKWLTLRSRTPG